GIPGLAGFFSKKENLRQTYSSPIGSKGLYAKGLITPGMTALFMWRLMYMTFYGRNPGRPQGGAKNHWSPAPQTNPPEVLALGSIVAGWIGIPKIWTIFPESVRYFERWLFPVFSSAALHEAAEEAAGAHHDVGLEWLLMGVSVAIAVIGIYIARVFY